MVSRACTRPGHGDRANSSPSWRSRLPLVAQRLIQLFGWPWTFAVLGLPGLIWGGSFYWWYRDDPAEHPSANEAERRFIALGLDVKKYAEDHPPIPWKKVLNS